MGKVILQFRDPAGPSSLEALCTRFGLRPDEVDTDYGVIEVDPQDHLYSVLVEQRVAGKLAASPEVNQAGGEIYGTPRVEPYGSPK